MKEDAYKRYLKTYSGQELLKKHDLEEEGTWHVFGEDPNCDLGGYHHQPDLGYMTGRLVDVVKAAVSMNSFWTWGGGGKIVKQNPPVAKPAKQVMQETNELQRLLKQREEIDARIKELGGK